MLNLRKINLLVVLMIISLCFVLFSSTILAEDKVDWKQASGSEIKLLFVSHPFVESIKPLIPQFEEKTGIKVDLEVLSEGTAFDKLLMDLQSKSGTYDIFMTDPLHIWQYAPNQWIEPLDEYVNNPELTNEENYKLDDFSPGLLNAGKWNRKLLEGVGKGSLWALPINYESYITAYRSDIFEKHNIEPPEYYTDVLDIAKELKPKLEKENNHVLTTRFERYWDLTFLTYGTMVLSYEENFINENGKINISSPKVVEATELYIEILKNGAPDGIVGNSWYDSMQQFSSGNYAMAFNEADLFAPTYENPEQSSVVGKVGYALPPKAPNDNRKASIWLWQLAMNSASKNKNASWLFLNWATSPSTMVETHLRGNMNPVRISAWDNPELKDQVQSWGESPGQYRKVQIEMLENVAGLYFPPHPELTRILEHWASAVQKSYFEGNTKENLENAQKEINNMM
jgi:multiple sugar transport system substrate-binding protein